MPDQTQNNEPVLSREEIEALPPGAVVRDSDGDIYTRVAPEQKRNDWDWVMNQAPKPSRDAEEIAVYSPVTLVSTSDQLDLHQQARIALRDRYGVEPDEDDIRRVCQAIDEGNLTPSAAVSALSLAKAYEEQKAPAAHEQTYQLTHDITVTITTGDIVASVTLEAGAYPGTARQTLHSITDRLADQIGALR